MKYEKSVANAIITHEILHLAYSGVGVYNLQLIKSQIEQKIHNFVETNKEMSTEEIYAKLVNYVRQHMIKH